jgi:hypothetical protein
MIEAIGIVVPAKDEEWLARPHRMLDVHYANVGRVPMRSPARCMSMIGTAIRSRRSRLSPLLRD